MNLSQSVSENLNKYDDSPLNFDTNFLRAENNNEFKTEYKKKMSHEEEVKIE